MTQWRSVTRTYLLPAEPPSFPEQMYDCRVVCYFIRSNHRMEGGLIANTVEAAGDTLVDSRDSKLVCVVEGHLLGEPSIPGPLKRVECVWDTKKLEWGHWLRPWIDEEDE